MPLITSANARELAAKAQAARRANRERQQNLDHTLADLSAKITALTPLPVDQLSGYAEKRLPRLREQLDRLDRLMAEETDPTKLDRLASAQFKTAEQERILAGRPLPGSIRTAVQRVKKGNENPGAITFRAPPITFSVPPAPEPVPVTPSTAPADQAVIVEPHAPKFVWTHGAGVAVRKAS